MNQKDKIKVITLKMPESLVDRINTLVESGKFSTRAETIRFALNYFFANYSEQESE